MSDFDVNCLVFVILLSKNLRRLFWSTNSNSNGRPHRQRPQRKGPNRGSSGEFGSDNDDDESDEQPFGGFHVGKRKTKRSRDGAKNDGNGQTSDDENDGLNRRQQQRNHHRGRVCTMLFLLSSSCSGWFCDGCVAFGMCVVLKCSNVDQGNVNDDSDDEDNDSIRDAEDFLKRHRPPPNPRGCVHTLRHTCVFVFRDVD